MRLGSLVCSLLVSIIYLMDFLYLQRGLESRPCRKILYIRCTHTMRVLFCVFRMSIHWRSPLPPPPPPPLHATDNSTLTFTFYFKYFLKIHCTFYLSTFCLCTFYFYSSRFIVIYKVSDWLTAICEIASYQLNS